MAERTKATVLKTVGPARGPWVRIPLLPRSSIRFDPESDDLTGTNADASTERHSQKALLRSSAARFSRRFSHSAGDTVESLRHAPNTLHMMSLEP